MNVVALIPARMAATRFPNKPMAKILDVPMIEHCYRRTALAKSVQSTYVATCDQTIVDFMTSIDGRSVMTGDHHERASDRCAEALLKIEKEQKLTIDIVAMVQGDEPLVTPEMIDAGIKPLLDDPNLEISNLIAPLTEDRFDHPNDVKVVFDQNWNALYFSREPIPSRKKWRGEIPMYKQLGLIFFRRQALLDFSAAKPTPLEIIESVDMNRVLEHGKKIKLVLTTQELIGVDAPEDIGRVEALLRHDPLIKTYTR